MQAADIFMSDSRLVRENAVTQDYLKTIWSAEENGQAGIAVRLLASRVGVAVSTASEKVKRLVTEGLAFHEPYGKVTLTEQGRRRALEVVRRHRLLETYLHDALGFEWDEVHEEAEILEHAISDRLLNRIDERLGHPVRDPHGDPIPSADGSVELLAMVPLVEVVPGDRVCIARFSDSDAVCLRSIENKGLGLDDQVEVRQRGVNGELVLSVYPYKTRSGAQKKERRLELSAQEAALISVVGMLPQ